MFPSQGRLELIVLVYLYPLVVFISVNYFCLVSFVKNALSCNGCSYTAQCQWCPFYPKHVHTLVLLWPYLLDILLKGLNVKLGYLLLSYTTGGSEQKALTLNVKASYFDKFLGVLLVSSEYTWRLSVMSICMVKLQTRYILMYFCVLFKVMLQNGKKTRCVNTIRFIRKCACTFSVSSMDDLVLFF